MIYRARLPHLVVTALALTSIAFAVYAETKASVSPKKARRYTVADFEKLVPGDTDYAAVTKILGEPLWHYSYFAKKNTMPVQLPESWGSPAISGGRPPDPSTLEPLRVLKYPADWPRDYYYVVLRAGKLYYSIGPIPDDERKPDAVEARYGTLTLETERALHGHIVKTVQVAWCRNRGIGFVRDGVEGDFSAKLRFAPLADQSDHDLQTAPRNPAE